MRIFIAIDIGEKVAENITSLQDEIRRSLTPKQSGIKWVNPEQIHLTLKFLGDVSEDQIADISRITARKADDYKEFSVEVKKVGSFGRPPRVIWIGTEENKHLSRLQAALDAKLNGIGFAPDEKKFIPHLTLCRVKNPATGKQLKRIIKAYDGFSAGKIHVKSLSVYKSELTKTGPEYTLLSRNDLI